MTFTGSIWWASIGLKLKEIYEAFTVQPRVGVV